MDSFTDEQLLPIPERLVRSRETTRPGEPFFLIEREYGMDRYARFGLDRQIETKEELQ